MGGWKDWPGLNPGKKGRGKGTPRGNLFTNQFGTFWGFLEISMVVREKVGKAEKWGAAQFLHWEARPFGKLTTLG